MFKNFGVKEFLLALQIKTNRNLVMICILLIILFVYSTETTSVLGFITLNKVSIFPKNTAWLEITPTLMGIGTCCTAGLWLLGVGLGCLSLTEKPKNTGFWD